MENERRIALCDGTGMGDELIIFKTNAPVAELKKLEKQSCQVYLDGGEYDDVPNWGEVLVGKGYTFEFEDSCRHITPYTSSESWKERNYPDVKETYTIENQPFL